MTLNARLSNFVKRYQSHSLWRRTDLGSSQTVKSPYFCLHIYPCNRRLWKKPHLRHLPSALQYNSAPLWEDRFHKFVPFHHNYFASFSLPIVAAKGTDVTKELRTSPNDTSTAHGNFEYGSQHEANDPNRELNDNKCQDSSQEESKQTQVATLKQLWSVLLPEKLRLKMALVALVVSSSATLSIPKLLGFLIDKFQIISAAGGSGSSVLALSELNFQLVTEQSCAILAAIFMGALASGFRLFLLETVSERIAYQLRLRLFESLMKKKVQVFDRIRTGELINRISGDVTVTSRVLLDLSFGIRNILTATVGTIAIFMIVPAQLVATLVFPVTLVFALGMAYGRFVRDLASQKQDRLSDCATRAEEKLSNIRTVRLFNGEKLEVEEFKKEMEAVYRVGFLNSLAIGGRSAIYYVAGGSLLLHLIHRCGVLISTGLVSLGDVTSLILYVMMTGVSYQGVITAYGDVQRALGACHKLLELIHDEQNEELSSLTKKSDQSIDPTPSTTCRGGNEHPAFTSSSLFSVPLISKSIEFNNISFAYPSRPDRLVLHNFSLCIPQHSVVAILGESGSGKSSLVSLLMRFYEPTSGHIQLGGVDISTRPPAWVRSQFGVVPQDTTLFAMTIRDNILYGYLAHQALKSTVNSGAKEKETKLENLSSASLKYLFHDRSKHQQRHIKNYCEGDLDRLLKTSHSANFLNAFPEGLATFVGEKGTSISGGQKQRICLARALARHPPFLILDEATSALDLRSEQLVHKALAEEVFPDTTTLIITHRLSMLRYVDYIGILVDGTLTQFGPREQVLASPSADFKRILMSQTVS